MCIRKNILIKCYYFFFQMKGFSVVMFSMLMAMLLVAITTVSSDDIKKEEKPLNRLARASGKGKCSYINYCSVDILVLI